MTHIYKVGFVLFVEKIKPRLAFAVGASRQECDLFSGNWVKEDEEGLTRPLYQESECPYIQPQLTCQEHGRPEKEYQFLKWKPHGCDLPRFVHYLNVDCFLR